MRHRWRVTGILMVAIALYSWGCATEIAPEIETERRFSGTVQGPPPAPPVPFDMSLFLRKLAAGQSGVTGGFTAGPVRGSVVGTMTGSFNNGTFNGRLIAPESSASTVLPGSGGNGLLALFFIPSMTLLARQGGNTGCIVEQQYVGELTPAGLVWTPREVVRSCPTNPLNFTIQVMTLTQPPSTSTSTTSTIPTTSIPTTTSTTSISTTTTTSIPPTTTTTTSVPTTTSTTTSIPTTTTTTIPPI